MATSSEPAIPKWIKALLFEPVFKEIFSNFKKIKNFKVVPGLSAGENYATVMLRILADTELDDGTIKDITLMLKTSHDSEAFREMMKNQKYSLFDLETLMYRTIIPQLENLYKEVGIEIKFAPKFYEIDTEEPYLLLEDLKPQGYKNFNRLEGFDMEHTKLMLTLLAQWHAASAVYFVNQGKCPEPFLKNFCVEENREMLGKIMDGITKSLLKYVPTYKGYEIYYESLCHYKDSIVNDLLEVNKLDESGFNVLNHGDCWSNNIMFNYDEQGHVQNVYLVDYQVPHFGTPAQDLYYVLLSSTCYEIKLENFDYFIRYYHDCLVKHLKLLKYKKEIPSLKDLHIMLHKSNAWAYNACTGVLAAVLLDPNENAKVDNYLNDSEEASQFRMQLYSNPRYRKHMEILLPWLYYRGVF